MLTTQPFVLISILCFPTYVIRKNNKQGLDYSTFQFGMKEDLSITFFLHFIIIELSNIELLLFNWNVKFYFGTLLDM